MITERIFVRKWPIGIVIGLFSIVLAVGLIYAATVALPRTGQIISYYSGDDGDIQAGVAWPSPRFTVTGDCVTDNLTGLMWGKAPDSNKRTWVDSLTFANNLSLCGHSDWRLPNVNELESLHFAIRKGKYKPGCDKRTKKWYYPGYTSIYISKKCPDSPDDDKDNNKENPIHQKIISEWINDPGNFIHSRGGR